MPFFALEFPFVMGNGKTGSFAQRYEFTGLITAADKLSILNAAQAAYIDTPALFCPDVTLGSARLYEYERVAGPPPRFQRTTTISVSSIAGLPGTAAGQSLPPQNSVVVTYRSPFPGPRNRGRSYTPPPPEGVTDGAGLISDTVARRDWVQQIAEAAEAAFSAADVDHIIHSAVGNSFVEVTAYGVSPRVDTQRRRRTRG